MSDLFYPQNTPPQVPQLSQADMEKILVDAPVLRCAAPGCGNSTFVEVAVFKFLSKLVSPKGQDSYVPVTVFACNACGVVNADLLPPILKQSHVSSAPEPTNKPKLEIVRP